MPGGYGVSVQGPGWRHRRASPARGDSECAGAGSARFCRHGNCAHRAAAGQARIGKGKIMTVKVSIFNGKDEKKVPEMLLFLELGKVHFDH